MAWVYNNLKFAHCKHNVYMKGRGETLLRCLEGPARLCENEYKISVFLQNAVHRKIHICMSKIFFLLHYESVIQRNSFYGFYVLCSVR